MPVSATINEMRAPYISRLSTSRPRKSVPSGVASDPPVAQKGGTLSMYGQAAMPYLAWHCSGVGGTGSSLLCGAISGAKTATTARNARIRNGIDGASSTTR